MTQVGKLKTTTINVQLVIYSLSQQLGLEEMLGEGYIIIELNRKRK